MRLVLVTGAAGFIGQELCSVLLNSQCRVRAAVRHKPQTPNPDMEYVECGNIHAATDWSAALRDVDAVVHLAGRSDSAESDSADGTNADPVAAATALFAAANTARVKTFIYASSIKVNGEDSGTLPYTAEQEPKPENAYARVKYDAEQALLKMDAVASLIIIRPPLVYGPGAKGNFALLKRAVNLGVPLPLASVRNARSWVSVFNLCDFIKTCIFAEHLEQHLKREIFVVSDGRDLSTPELIRLLAGEMDKKARLLPCPPGLLLWAAGLVGKRDMLRRLCGNLQVDIQKNKQLLDWMPPFTVEESLHKSVSDDKHRA